MYFYLQSLIGTQSWREYLINACEHHENAGWIYFHFCLEYDYVYSKFHLAKAWNTPFSYGMHPRQNDLGLRSSIFYPTNFANWNLTAREVMTNNSSFFSYLNTENLNINWIISCSKRDKLVLAVFQILYLHMAKSDYDLKNKINLFIVYKIYIYNANMQR